MANQDLDSMSDDDFMSALDDAAYEDESVEATDNIEDTDQQEEADEQSEPDTETNEQIDDEAQDTDEDDDYEFDELAEENSQAENNNEEGDSDDEDSGSENDTDNTNDGTEQGEKAEELDYKEEYAKLLEQNKEYEAFHEKITGEFMANGRKTKGFTDPEKIIQSQQMAAGLGEKMAAFKPYRPFMNTLKERGMLENPEQFNLAMQLLDKDPEALKKQLKAANIDPIEMDMENINYTPKNEISTDIEIALDDVMESATQHGVDAKVREIISNDWDDDSVIELLNDPENSSDLIDHISSGIYDVVQDRIAEKRRSDNNQIYTSKSKIEQYREAAVELEGEYMRYLNAQAQSEPEVAPQQAEQTDWIDTVQNEQTEEYVQKVEKQKAKTDDARRKATSLSKKKRGTRKPKQQVDPLTLDDDKFTEYLDSVIYQ